MLKLIIPLLLLCSTANGQTDSLFKKVEYYFSKFDSLNKEVQKLDRTKTQDLIKGVDYILLMRKYKDSTRYCSDLIDSLANPKRIKVNSIKKRPKT